LESSDYLNTASLAIFLGGDSDTTGCITRGIAEAIYGKVPDSIKESIENITQIWSKEEPVWNIIFQQTNWLQKKG
jgi:ADP-ribosylglycohydrolase